MNITDLQLHEALESPQWVVISQKMINDFANATGDHQWIHIDEQRCKEQSPFGTTIAHGFLTASLLPQQFDSVFEVDPTQITLINYGIDNLRFLEPVRSGDSVRFSFKLAERIEKPSGQLHRFSVTASIKVRQNPALVGDFLMLMIKNKTA